MSKNRVINFDWNNKQTKQVNKSVVKKLVNFYAQKGVVEISTEVADYTGLLECRKRCRKVGSH